MCELLHLAACIIYSSLINGGGILFTIKVMVILVRCWSRTSSSPAKRVPSNATLYGSAAEWPRYTRSGKQTGAPGQVLELTPLKWLGTTSSTSKGGEEDL